MKDRRNQLKKEVNLPFIISVIVLVLILLTLSIILGHAITSKEQKREELATEQKRKEHPSQKTQLVLDQADKHLKKAKINDPKAKPRVALTFDDGPSLETTPELLKILKEKKVNATFFVLGANFEKNPEIVKQAKKDGNEIGSHSFNHKNFVYLSTEQATADHNRVNELFKSHLNMDIPIFRPPYGSTNKRVLSTLKVPNIMWSVDSLDWKSKNSQMIQQTVKQNVKPGSIVLMHDIYPTTVASVGNVIDSLQESGYEIVTVSELLSYDGETALYFSQSDKQQPKS